MISNSQGTPSQKKEQIITESTQKKRTRELEDDSAEGEKLSKMENSETSLKLINSNNGRSSNEEEREDGLVEINSQFYNSQNRNFYQDFIWKVDVPKKEFTNLRVDYNLLNRENIEYQLSLKNVFYGGSQSSSLIFVLQNGRGLDNETLSEDLSKMEEFLFKKDKEDQLTQQASTIAKKIKQINSERLSFPASSQETQAKINNSNNLSGMMVDIDIPISLHDKSKSNNNDFSQESINSLKAPEENKINRINGEIINLEKTEEKINEPEQINLITNETQSDADLTSIRSSVVESNSCAQSQAPSNTESLSSVGSIKSRSVSENENVPQSQSSQSSEKENSNQPQSPSVPVQFTYTPIDTHVFQNDLSDLKGNYYNPEEKNEKVEINTTYDVFLKITVVNYKSLEFTFKDVKLGQILLKEIALNSLFYSHILPKEDPKIVIEVQIRKSYNQDTGYTGIINEAMTCYMNSMLQTLNILGYFKKAVFQIPISDDKTKSVPFSLQRLFYDLMNENEPISTNKLTQSFGWSRDQIFVQHDVQEFNLLLSDVMENSMKGTKVEGTFKHLFEGKILNYIECLDVDYKSNKVEPFCDLQLTIKGCKNIYESLNKYTEEEILDNDDKYHTEEYGKQRAKKGIKFESFPNVLILQLKRFEYNPRKDSMDKINDFFQFYDEIDLSSYLTDQNGQDNSYSLHSVVVHKGGINSGHYYAYIRPGVNNQWYMFNDEFVRECDYDEVFTYNYGGVLELSKHRDRGNIIRINSRPDANAYILVYIKNTVRNSILCDVKNSDIPKNITDLIQKEKEDERRAEILLKRKRENINIFFIPKENIMSHTDLGILPPSSDLNFSENLFTINDTYVNLPKNLPIKYFLLFISEKTKIPIEYLNLYVYIQVDPQKASKRHNYKINHVTEDFIFTKRIIDIFTAFNTTKFFLKEMFLFVDINIPKRELNTNYINYDYKIFENNMDIQGLKSPSVDSSNSNSNSLLNFFEDEDEYITPDEENSIIYIRKRNKFIFKQNLDFDYNPNLSKQFIEEKSKIYSDVEILERENLNKLFFIKYLNFNQYQGEQRISFVMDEIISLNYDSNGLINKQFFSEFVNLRNFKEIYKKYLKNNEPININDLDNYEISFVLEKTCGGYEKPKKKVTLTSSINMPNNIVVNENISPISTIENIEKSSQMEIDTITTSNQNNTSITQIENLVIEERVSQQTISDIINNNDVNDINRGLPTQSEQENLQQEEEEETNYLTIEVDDVFELLNQNKFSDAFILIVNLKRIEKNASNINNNNLHTLKNLINSHCMELFSNVYCNIYYVKEKNPIQIHNFDGLNTPMKFKFSLTDSVEDIHCQLFVHLSSIPNSFKNLLTENLEIFYLASNKSILNQDEFIKYLQKENLYIFDARNPNTSAIIQEINEFPLLKFIGASRSQPVHDIHFTINYSTEEDYISEFFVLFDINNNPICKVNCNLPQEIKSCEDVLTYLENSLIKRFYPIEMQQIPLENFYFIMQHTHSTFAYDIFTDKSQDLFQYKSKQDLSIVYRLQPFSHDDIESFHSNHLKLFLEF
jgi:ubiquitin C-terminal hydrolase